MRMRRSAAQTAAVQPLMDAQASQGVRHVVLTGWRSRLAVAVVALLCASGVTGLWIYLAPFSKTSQIVVFAHVAGGLALVAPFAVYLWRHIRTWWTQRLTAVMALGYMLLLIAVLCIASGIVVTWQAAMGPRLSMGWDLVHFVSGLAITALLGLHLVLAVRRRRPQGLQWPEHSAAVRRMALVAAAAPVAVLTVARLSAQGSADRPLELPLPAGYTLPDYSQQFAEYRGSPFAPSYARTAGGGLINPDVLSGSESCGESGCHESIVAEWQPSAHRFAAMNPPFQQVQLNFAADREPAETRYCAGCHDPISLFAGAKDIHHQDLSAPGMNEGISCAVCHSISEVDQRGNADYVITPPQEYLWTGAEGWRRSASHFLVRAYPLQHLADYDRNILRSGEFCGACHKQFIPEALNRFGLSPGQNQFDEWRQSHWHTDDPATDLSCRDCHMRLVHESSDPGRGEGGDVRRSPNDGAHRHHGTIGTNMLMPEVLKLPGWEEQVRLTIEWMQGDTVIPEIADDWPAGPVATIELIGPDTARRGERITVRAVITNRKAGHNFTTGPLDFMQAWVHLRVEDASGELMAEFGSLDPLTRYILDDPGQTHVIGNARDEGTLVLEGMPLDEFGSRLLQHELWRKAGGEGQRVIFPRYSDTQQYAFDVPAHARGPLSVAADLNFRRYRQDFLDRVVPSMETDAGVRQRVVAHDSALMEVALEPPATSSAQSN
jgi:hypothetical protein